MIIKIIPMLNRTVFKRIVQINVLSLAFLMVHHAYADDVLVPTSIDVAEVPVIDQVPAMALKPTTESTTVQKSRFLPIWGDEARAQGYELPEPFGAGYAYMHLKQDIVVDNINIIIPPTVPLIKGIYIDAGATSQTSETHLARFDAWVLPFMNVYALLGKTKGSSTTVLENGSYITKIGPFTQSHSLPVKGELFQLDFKGDTYGVGTTLAGGYQDAFALVDVNYTRADLDILDGEIKALVVTPRIGYTFSLAQLFEGHGNAKLQLWTGAMYQDITQNFRGNINQLNLPASIQSLVNLFASDMKFDVKQHLANKWNPLIGARFELTPHFNFTTEVGFDQRKTFMFTGEYRF